MKKIQVIDGLSITDISLGAGRRGYEGKDEEQFRIMDKYLELGGNCFDTARMYANGECDKSLGAYFKSRGNRSDVIICTKGSHPTDTAKMYISRLSKQEIEADLDASLASIGTDHTDLHLLHRDDPKLPVGPIVEAMDGLVKSGKARAVGVSNWSVTRIADAIEYAEQHGLTKPSLCQLHYSLLETTVAATGDVTHVPMNDIERRWYMRTGFPIMGFGSQGRGYIVCRANGGEQKPGPVRYYGRLPENAERVDRLIALANELNVTSASVALAYTRDSGLRASALCGFSSMDQLMDAMGALSFNLTDDQIGYLEGK